jgi:hypothetical protein
LESEQQRLFVARFRLDPRTRDWPACAIPNGGRRGKVEASILKAEGVSAGAPDWMCFRNARERQDGTRWNGVALEFKTATGRTSPEQRAWHTALEAEGWRVVVVRSADEAWAVLCDTYGLTP